MSCVDWLGMAGAKGRRMFCVNYFQILLNCFNFLAEPGSSFLGSMNVRLTMINTIFTCLEFRQIHLNLCLKIGWGEGGSKGLQVPRKLFDDCFECFNFLAERGSSFRGL